MRSFSSIVLAVLFLFVSLGVHAQSSSWKQCENIPSLNETCVSLEMIDSQYLNVQLTINDVTYLNQTVSKGIVQRTFCVNQDELISLMTDTPALSPYQSQVNATISDYGYIPYDDYSVCVLLQDTDLSGNTFNGCTSVDATLMCFDTGCLYKGIVSFGCWTIS